jgi:hypothetical protein
MRSRRIAAALAALVLGTAIIAAKTLPGQHGNGHENDSAEVAAES